MLLFFFNVTRIFPFFPPQCTPSLLWIHVKSVPTPLVLDVWTEAAVCQTQEPKPLGVGRHNSLLCLRDSRTTETGLTHGDKLFLRVQAGDISFKVDLRLFKGFDTCDFSFLSLTFSCEWFGFLLRLLIYFLTINCIICILKTCFIVQFKW